MRALKVGLLGGVFALCAATSAQAAVLSAILVDCRNGAIPAGSDTIFGTVGDTVVITALLNNCANVTANPASITGPATIAAGASQTYNLVAAGVGNISLLPQTGIVFNIPFRVTAAPVAANTKTVPTLSEYAMIALASLMAMGGIWTMRKRGKF